MDHSIAKLNHFSEEWRMATKTFLPRFIKVRNWSWVLVVVCIAIIFGLGSQLQSEIAPLEDKGNVRLQITGPEGASYGYMMDAGKDLGNFLIDSIRKQIFPSSNCLEGLVAVVVP